MKAKILIAFFLMTCLTLRAQTDEWLINQVLFEFFSPTLDTVSLILEKEKTYFDYDSLTFYDETGFQIPEKTLSELKMASNNLSETESWNEDEFNIKKFFLVDNDTVYAKRPYIKCYSYEQVDNYFNKYKKRKHFYLISKPIFDSKRENAIVSVTRHAWIGEFHQDTYLLKKIYGKWIVVATFGMWLT
jgi:hypothetical protein